MCKICILAGHHVVVEQNIDNCTYFLAYICFKTHVIHFNEQEYQIWLGQKLLFKAQYLGLLF